MLTLIFYATLLFIRHYVAIILPNVSICIVPDVYGLSLTAPHTQIVGQSLTLECSVTTVRGITSRVDIVWSSDGSILNRENNISRDSNTENFAVYTNTYAITPLGVSDDGRTYWCEAVINSKPPVTASHNITLDVIGM